jgi:hypothetical protein
MQGCRVKVVPLINAVRRYDAATEKKVYIQTPNADFKAMGRAGTPGCQIGYTYGRGVVDWKKDVTPF